MNLKKCADKMVVKLQVPLYSTEVLPYALVYNFDRTIEFKLKVDHHILSVLAGRHKAFFFAHVADDNHTILLELEDEVLDPGW